MAAFAAVSLGLASPAAAQDDYRALVSDAVSHAREGELSEALALFLRAHELRPSARTWRGVGLVRFGLADYAGAIAALEASLEDERRPLDEAHREQAEAMLARARRYVTVVRVVVAPGDAWVRVDGELREGEGPLVLNPGEHVLRFGREGHRSERRTLTVEGEGARTLEVELSPIETSPPPSRDAPLRVAAHPEGLAFHAIPIDADGAPDRHAVSDVCVAPCDAELPVGLYRFGLGRPGEEPRVLGDYRVEEPLGVQLHFDDREPLRILGWVLIATMTVPAIPLVSVAVASEQVELQGILGVITGGVFTLGLSVGIPLAALEDGTGVEVRPLEVAP